MSSIKVNVEQLAETTPTSLEDIPKIVASLHATFATNKTRDLAWRRDQLRKLYNFLDDQYDLISEALYKDLNKDAGTVLHDVMIASSEAAHFLEHLDEYARPIRAKKTLMTLFDRNRILLDPLGVVCIIGTWNYPIQLLLGPLACAIAAGNCALLKPSEVATHTEALLLEWVPRIFDNDAIRIVSGGIPQATAILAQKFDHIFYTGNESVGKIILTAAAKHLTPVTLELGGKCPAYVDSHIANIDTVATRIMFGKLANMGQTCIAPDYILVHEKIATKLVPALKKALVKLYTDNPRAVAQYGRVINKNHTQRLVDVLQRQLALNHSRVVAGGEFDVDERYVAPLIVAGVTPEDPLMESEIFGPLLGIIEVSSVENAIAIINSKSHSLMLYIHSDNAKVVEKVIGATRSGSVSVNDYLVNMALSDLPFGGVGGSGMGAYHGRTGFL
ncbi:Aldehyde dehydrogenase, partial [Physocladia obscura]